MSNPPIVIRPATTADAIATTSIFDRANPAWATTPRQHRRQTVRPAPTNGVMLVAEHNDRILGTARANEALEGLIPQPRTYSARVAVDPGAAGQGIGGRLWHAVRAWLDPQSPNQIISWADRDDHRSVAITSHWGFHRQPGSVENPDDLEAAEPWAWDYELRLAPTHDLDPTNGTPLPPAVTVSPLAAVLNDPQLSASLHEIHEECRTDVPAWDPYEPKPHSDFVRLQQERLEDGGGGLIAHRNGQVLAATFTDRAAFVPILHNDFTMVHRSARGQHLALTLKRRLVHEAAVSGIERITTEVRTDNHPMLAINATLGFRRIAMRHLVRSAAPE